MPLFQPPPTDRSAGGLFAPPHIAGNAGAEATLEQWRVDRPHVTRDIVEQSRILPPLATSPVGGPAKRGISEVRQVGDTRGYIDPEALRAQAWGLPYDIEAQRNRIAARIAEYVAAGYGSSIPGAEFTGGR